MSGGLVLAVDGGNVKTDLALVGVDGRLLSLVRGGRSSPHHVGVEGCIDVLEDLLAQARVGRPTSTRGPLHSRDRPDHDRRRRSAGGADGAARRDRALAVV